MKRVMIIGGSGAGKSTLAKILAEKTNLPIIHLDQFFWKPYWELRSKEELNALVSDAIAMEEWIIDGNNSDNFPARIKRADTLIFLDLPRWTRVYRVIKRMILGYGKSRSDMQDNCPERFNLEYLKFVKFVYNYDENGRLQAISLVNNAPDHMRVFHFKNKKEVVQFVNSF